MARGGLRFLYLLQFPSYDVIIDVITSDADCTPGREPRSVAASYYSALARVTRRQRAQPRRNSALSCKSGHVPD